MGVAVQKYRYIFLMYPIRSRNPFSSKMRLIWHNGIKRINEAIELITSINEARYTFTGSNSVNKHLFVEKEQENWQR